MLLFFTCVFTSLELSRHDLVPRIDPPRLDGPRLRLPGGAGHHGKVDLTVPPRRQHEEQLDHVARVRAAHHIVAVLLRAHLRTVVEMRAHQWSVRSFVHVQLPRYRSKPIKKGPIRWAAL